MVEIFGLDFGTTNSLASIVLQGKAQSLTDVDTARPHPSVICYRGEDIIVGRKAKDRLSERETGVVGSFVRSPKSHLGSAMSLHVAGVAREPSDVVAEILRHIRNDARGRSSYRDRPFDRAIVSIPVNMSGRARKDLRNAALKAGIHVHQFVHEPLAALYGHLRAQSDYPKGMAELNGQYVLVFDWGGGTLDLTLVRVESGRLVQIVNMGDNTVGGDRFDERLRDFVKRRHAEQHKLDGWPGEMENVAATLIGQCELAKINLSSRSTYVVYIKNFLRSEGPDKTLEVTIGRDDLETLSKDIVDQGMKDIDDLLQQVNLPDQAISLFLATGGMVGMPRIRQRLIERFGIERVPEIPNGDRIISEGNAWIAFDNLRLCLAKPFELLHSDNTYVTLLPDSLPLPLENGAHSQKMGLYCVDPRDGFAKFQFCRPRYPGRSQPADRRINYTNLVIAVDPTAEPFRERLELTLEIDHDLIVHAKAESRILGDFRSAEIHDLEFGLDVDDGGGVRRQNSDDVSFSDVVPVPGAIETRSNISAKNGQWHLVPGEIVEDYRPHFLDVRNPRRSKRQIDEKMYYQPCVCGKLIHEIRRDGCSICGEPTPEQAARNMETVRSRITKIKERYPELGSTDAMVFLRQRYI